MTTDYHRYIGLKFDEVNQHLLNLAKDNKRRTKPRNSSLYQRRSSSQPSNNEWMTWTVIHLHLELRKISCEIDSIFGVQMTFKMGCYFCWLAIDLREIFGVILVNNYITSNKTLYAIIMLIWLCHNILKLFFLNYVCEAVSTKANATANLMKKISYSTYDIEIRENISLFLLQITQAPVRFCGMGLFQFGYKFLYGFSSLITTVVVLLIQAIMNKQTFLKNN
ncbi:gustatory and pheromone receptor 32a-like [Nylanderia fulva]|uniref:gustatory and pheromone receptor 32a-like n=1 Tax=Nylanderia fulva TaxID=613905 RepID=UPI0010FB9802|nr:gustatory and pheromone receptor 32a-like [Nylanderia fulva]